MKPIFTGNCVCANEHISRWKLNGLNANASIFFDAGSDDCLCGDFRRWCYCYTFSGIFLSPSARNVGVEVESLKRAFSWKFHHFYLSPDPFIFAQYLRHFLRFCSQLTEHFSLASIHFIPFGFIWFAFLIAFDTLGQWHCGVESERQKWNEE